MRYPNLLSPFTLNKLTLRNRVVSTAHAEVYAEPGGLPGDRYIRYYEEKAKGGLGLAICGGSSPVSIDSPQGWRKSVNLSNDNIIEPLARLAETMHRHGAKIMIQATHMGRRSAFHGEHWPHLMTPSGIREPVHRGNAKIIEIEEIRRIVADFALAARLICPPTASLFSNSTTSWPRERATRAASNPPGPPPTTTTFRFSPALFWMMCGMVASREVAAFCTQSTSRPLYCRSMQ